MITVSNFYREFVVKKLSALAVAKSIITENMTLPFYSVVYYPRLSAESTQVNTADPVLASVDSVYVYNVFRYTESAVQPFRLTHRNKQDIIAAIGGESDNVVNLKPDHEKFMFTTRNILVYNYTTLSDMYIYNEKLPLIELNQWNNMYDTMIEQVNNPLPVTANPINRFIVFNIPLSMLSFKSFEMYVNAIDTNSVAMKRKFSDYRVLNLLDLWLYLTPKYREHSKLFSLIDSRIIDLVNVVFMFSNRTGIVNLGMLNGFVSEYNNMAGGTELAVHVRKKLYTFISMLSAQIDTTFDIDAVDDVLADPNDLDTADDDTPESTPDDLSTSVGIDIDDVSVNGDVALFDAVNDNTYVELDDIKNYKNDVTEKLSAGVDKKLSDGSITKTVSKTLQSLLDGQKNTKSDYAGGIISEVLDYTADVNELTDRETIASKDYLKVGVGYTRVRNKVLTEKYITSKYKKDIVRAIYGLQKGGVIISNHEVTTETSLTGGVENHKVSLVTLDNRRHTITFTLNVVDKNGTMKIGGNTYIMRKQRADIPIKKISPTEVALTTYTNKIFVDTAKAMRYNAGYTVYKKLLKKQEDGVDGVQFVIPGELDTVDLVVPTQYGKLSSFVKSFTHEDVNYCLDYYDRGLFLGIDNKDIDRCETDGDVVVGKGGSDIYVVSRTNTLIRIGKKRDVVGDFFEHLGADSQSLPVEYSTMSLYSTKLPVIAVLIMRLGFNQVIKAFNTHVFVLEKRNKQLVDDGYMVVRLYDAYIYIERDNGISDMILGGLVAMSKELSTITKTEIYSKNIKRMLYTAYNISPNLQVELNTVFDLFVDSITEAMLVELKEPTTLEGLLIRGSELLLDRHYKNPLDSETLYFRGYERVAGMVHNEFVRSLIDYRKKERFKNAKMSMRPYAIVSKQTSDSTNVIHDDLNPLASIKQSEEFSYLGFGGRSAIAMNLSARAADESSVGITSEASKDSGDVGLTGFLSGDPSYTNMLGYTKLTPDDQLTVANILSTPSLMMPFIDRDDPKRVSFSNIMASHIVPLDNPMVPYVRTPYDNVVAMKSDEKFAAFAKDVGVVVSVTDHKVGVRYGTSKDVTEYTIGTWTSKEESGKCYTHRRVPNVKVGEKFSMGDCLLYDECFFSPDVFDKTKLVYMSSTNLRIVQAVDRTTNEDSISLSSKVTAKLKTTTTAVISKIVEITDNVKPLIKIGDSVVPDTPLYVIGNSIGDTEDMDEATIEILKRITSVSPRAKVVGTVSDISVLYNADIKDASPQLRKMINTSDSYHLAKIGYTGKVNSSYRIQGEPLQPNHVEIRYLIDVHEIMGHSDKAIVGSQLKCTVGDIMVEDRRTEDGLEVDGLFCPVGIGARNVDSADTIGALGVVLEKMTLDILDVYYGEKK